MTVRHEEIDVRSSRSEETIDITSRVKAAVTRSKIKDGIVAVAPELGTAATGLLEHLVTDAHEIVTVIEGEGATAADTRRITEWLAEHHPDVSTEVHHGGQPLYPYLVSVE